MRVQKWPGGDSYGKRPVSFSFYSSRTQYAEVMQPHSLAHAQMISFPHHLSHFSESVL